jgi:predicted nucleic acid-binding protein
MLRTEVSNKLIDFSYLTTKIWLEREEDESTCKQDLQKRIELINWALETMKNPNIPICSVIESKMNEIIERVKQTYSIVEAHKLHNELRILDRILYQVCSDEIKKSLTIDKD